MAKNRTIPHDSLALRYAFDSSVPGLRKAAIDHVKDVVKSNEGSTKHIAEELGISVSTWWRWVQAVPELQKAHYGERTDDMRGRLPAALVAAEKEQSAKRRSAKRAAAR